MQAEIALDASVVEFVPVTRRDDGWIGAGVIESDGVIYGALPWAGLNFHPMGIV